MFEARAGVQRAEEANKILAATSKLAAESAEQTKQGVKQAEESSKQNRSLMIFTIVTIIFVSDESLTEKGDLYSSADLAPSKLYLVNFWHECPRVWSRSVPYLETVPHHVLVLNHLSSHPMF